MAVFFPICTDSGITEFSPIVTRMALALTALGELLLVALRGGLAAVLGVLEMCIRDRDMTE